jgi:O-methyltransferase
MRPLLNYVLPIGPFRASLGRQYRSVQRELKIRRYGAVYDRFRDFTMIPRILYINNLILAERVSALPGCVVECGVWRGGMSAGLPAVLGTDRQYFLFDSFEGLPPAKEVDGESAIRWQQNPLSPDHNNNCTAGEDFADRAMTLSGSRSFHLVKGWFEKTLPSFRPPEPIALLRLDADWYDSTMVCLKSLFDSMLPQGLIIIDDYYTWDGCSRAVHDFLSQRSAVERIQSSPEGVCFLQKAAALKT